MEEEWECNGGVHQLFIDLKRGYYSIIGGGGCVKISISLVYPLNVLFSIKCVEMKPTVKCG
jgi:hypothetical protein